MCKIVKVVWCVTALFTSLTFAVEAVDDVFDIRASSGLVVTGGDATMGGVPAEQMFDAGVTLYTDTGAAQRPTILNVSRGCFQHQGQGYGTNGQG